MQQRLRLAAALAGLIPAAALAQESGTLQVAQSDRFGEHLATADGRPVYLFTADTQGMEGQEAQISCTGECLDAWPPVTVEGTVDSGENVQHALIGSIPQDDGTLVVTYNGWPLYHFASDTGADPQGQDIESFGGEWYLVRPDGTQVEGD